MFTPRLTEAIENKWRDLYGMGYVRINCIKFKDRKHAIRYMLKYITKDIKKPGKRKRIFTASRHALLKIVKPRWMALQVYIGRVTDKGVSEEKVSYNMDVGHGYCGVTSSDRIAIVPKTHILKTIMERRLQQLLVTEI